MNRLLSLAIFLFIQIHLTAQSNHHYKNLVLEGGGIRGFAYSGAFEVLDSLHILNNIERVGGSSAGAIQATLLSLGYSTQEMTALAATIPLRKFNDGFLPGGFARMKHRFGFFKGEKITSWIEQLIAAKTGDANITFLQLHYLKNAKHYKDLYIAGTDLTYRCLRIFSYESYPNMRVKDALRISFAIPLYYEPVFIDDAGTVQRKMAAANIHLMADCFRTTRYRCSTQQSMQMVMTALTGISQTRLRLAYCSINRTSLIMVTCRQHILY